ncbi:MAG: glucose-1-phosphate thymidylyltransferase [Candidatus Nanopusillus acidilobi]
MKGIILHGGAGTRLRPITHTGPKQLIPIGNKPMSQYTLEYLTNSGIRDIAIILGDIYPEKVREYYGDGSNFNCSITYINQGKPLGIAHAIYLARDFVGDDKFVVILGDNLIGESIEKFTKKFVNSDYDAYLLFSETSHPWDFGVAKFSNDGRLIGMIEKPKNPPSNYAITGIYYFNKKIFDHIKDLKPSWRGELEITEAIQSLMDSGGRIGYDIIKGWWKDTGTVEDILSANRLVLDSINGSIERINVQGKVILGKNVKISDDSKVRGPAIIGDNVEIIEGAFIGPYTSIGENCKVKRASIENSIIMKNSVIDTENIIIDSIIGEGSQIMNANSLKPKGIRLIIGENSKMHI